MPSDTCHRFFFLVFVSAVTGVGAWKRHANLNLRSLLHFACMHGDGVVKLSELLRRPFDGDVKVDD